MRYRTANIIDLSVVIAMVTPASMKRTVGSKSIVINFLDDDAAHAVGEILIIYPFLKKHVIKKAEGNAITAHLTFLELILRSGNNFIN